LSTFGVKAEECRAMLSFDSVTSGRPVWWLAGLARDSFLSIDRLLSPQSSADGDLVGLQ
jgi:hypothetical protein